MTKIIFALITLALTFGNNPTNAQSNQVFLDRLDKGYNFCRNRGFSSTDAYMETDQFNIAICTLPRRRDDGLTDSCYTPSHFYLFLQSKSSNQISIINVNQTWNNRYFPDSLYTFRGIQNGTTYELKTNGGSLNYDLRHFTSLNMTQNGRAVYTQRVNYYVGDIGMGC